MTTAEYFGLARPNRERFNEGFGAILARAWRKVRRWHRVRNAIGELRELDDRMLKDIGLSRSTIYAAAKGSYGFGDGRNDAY